MIRLLLVIPTLERGGAEKQFTLLATGLPRDRFDVQVAVLTRTGPLEAALTGAGVPVTVIGKRWRLDPLAYRRLSRAIGAVRPDIVHTWLFAANCYGRRAAFARRVRRVVAGERCVDAWKGSAALRLDRALARRTDVVVANSTGVRDFYVAQGLPAEKFVVIPNGIAVLPPAGGPAATRAALLRDLGLPPSATLVGTVSRLWPQKRVGDVIAAFDRLHAERPDLHLLIVGDGPEGSQLRRRALASPAGTRVHFLGERADVPRILAGLSGLVLASIYEGQSNVLMEGMAAGAPVVATRIAGTTDLVVDGESGLLVPVGDPTAIAGALARLLDEPDLARRLGAAGRARMLTEFSVERMVERYAHLYEALHRGRA